MSTLLIFHECRVPPEQAGAQRGSRLPTGARKELLESQPHSRWLGVLIISLSTPGWPRLPHRALLHNTPPGPCSAFVDQSLWVYPEIIKIPMFKPLKLWQWKPSHASDWALLLIREVWGPFAAWLCPWAASPAITFSLWLKRMNIFMLNQTAIETLCL